jgi:Asp-tRNA(Asn)/Glu-tRNA(Gln) amidotransferase B subunit
MEAKINNYLFKLDKLSGIIEIFRGSEASRPCGIIRVDLNISLKDFHIEIADWYMTNSGF